MVGCLALWLGAHCSLFFHQEDYHGATTVILIVDVSCKWYCHLSSTVSLTQPMLNQPLLVAWLCVWSLILLHFSIRRTMEPSLSFWLLICPATIIHFLQSPECSQLAMLNWPWLVAWLCGCSVFPSGGLPWSQHCHSDCWLSCYYHSSSLHLNATVFQAFTYTEGWTCHLVMCARILVVMCR